MYKTVLCFLLFSCAVWIGVLRAKEYRQGPAMLLALADSLSVLRSEICTLRIPLPDAIQKCVGLYPLTKPFYDLLLVGIRSDLLFSDVWQLAVQQIPFLQESDRNALTALGTQIGRYNAETQHAAFSVCIDTLRSHAKQIGAESNTRARLTLSLCTAGGLLLCVMLY